MKEGLSSWPSWGRFTLLLFVIILFSFTLAFIFATNLSSTLNFVISVPNTESIQQIEPHNANKTIIIKEITPLCIPGFYKVTATLNPTIKEFNMSWGNRFEGWIENYNVKYICDSTTSLYTDIVSYCATQEEMFYWQNKLQNEDILP